MSIEQRNEEGWLFLYAASIYFIILLLFFPICPLTMQLHKWHRSIYHCIADKRSRENVLQLNVRGRHQKNTSQLVTLYWSPSTQRQTNPWSFVRDRDTCASQSEVCKKKVKNKIKHFSASELHRQCQKGNISEAELLTYFSTTIFLSATFLNFLYLKLIRYIITFKFISVLSKY